ncbi:MAG: tetratricopeptide repeat protein [Sporichthyaceae bacterium]
MKPTSARVRRTSVIAGSALALFIGGAVGLGLTEGDGGGSRRTVVGDGASAPRAAGEIPRLQQRLAEQPSDAAAWAALGSAYVEQSRLRADPGFYAKAEQALRRSLELEQQGNLAAYVAMGALANSRHDFAAALEWGKRARAVSDFSPEAYGVLVDAYTQLGRADRASTAAQRMLNLQPTLPALARAAYDLEQRGRIPLARTLLAQALEQALDPAAIAFVRYQLGELALNSGDLRGARRHYDAGLVTDPRNSPLLHGRAKVAALSGNVRAALRDYAELVSRVPNPQYLVEYGEVLTKFGRDAEAREQFAFARTVQELFAADGSRDDLALAEYEADHGSPALALRLARAEWERRQFVVVADTLAWALHKDGRSAEALAFADRALARGWCNALFYHHRSEIHRALGDADAAKADTARMRECNPAFDPELAALGRST